MFQNVSEYDQGIEQLHNTDQPTASRGRVTEHSSIPRVKEIVCRIEVTGWNCSHNNHRGNNYGHGRCPDRASYSRTDHHDNFCIVNGKQSADVSIKAVFIRTRGYKTFFHA